MSTPMSSKSGGPARPPLNEDSLASLQHPAPTNGRERLSVEVPAKSGIPPLSRLPSPSADHFPALSPHTADRIFPIKSLVNVENPSDSSVADLVLDENTSSASRASISRLSSTNGPSSVWLDVKNAQSARRPKTLSASSWVSTGSITRGNSPKSPESENMLTTGFYTSRHQHVQTEEGHMVITGVSGAEKMQRCEDEPIHIPGAVQGFGCLVALKEEHCEDSSSRSVRLSVRIVSENSKSIIGYSPSELFARRDFCSILSDEQVDELLDHIEYMNDGTDPRIDGPEVFSMIVTGPDAIQIKLWCALHKPENNPSDMIICEFELEDDDKFPLMNGVSSLEEPENTLGQGEHHEDVIKESTISASRPLRMLRNSRRKRGEGVLEVFNLLSQIQEQMANATNQEDFLKVIVGIVKELTGFHRVMIYQFDEMWNGQVVTELADPRATKDLFRGLHFPASDIPAQARELYKINKVRLLYDREQTTARLVCNDEADLKTPLDLTHSQLRAMSPIHLKYLANMSVRASMSISITAFGQLWGLISCHSYGNGMRVPFPTRKMCRLLGDAASRNIERLTYTRRLYSRKMVNYMPSDANPSGYIVASSEDLLALFDADYGMLSIRDETKVLGNTNNSQEALAMLEYLRIKNFTAIISSQDLAKDFSDFKYPHGFESIAGLLLVPLSERGDFIVFFRKPQLKNVHWAGNPYEKVMREGTAGFLEPRTSFKQWSEQVKGTSKKWTEEQIETAGVLCLVYGKFIEVWRQKEAAEKNSHLTKLLLANASHEVRTPLNAIINYLEIALESPLDSSTRENLTRSHTASKSLIYVINDLLDLTRTEGGHDLVQSEEFDLQEMIYDATEMFRVDSKRQGISFEIVEYPDLPSRVKGDPKRLRQVISNITANAVNHTSKGGIKIEIRTAYFEDNRCEVEIAVQDSGVGMSAARIDTLFREFEQVQSDDEFELREDTSDTDDDRKTVTKVGGQMLGLGLAVVARIIRNMNGQLRLKSEEGKGSRFTVVVPLVLAATVDMPPVSTSSVSSPEPIPGEVTLVPGLRGSASTGNLRTSRRRASSNGSVGSAKSELHRLVDAISGSPIAGSPTYDKKDGARSAARARPLMLRKSTSDGAMERLDKSSSGKAPSITGLPPTPAPSSQRVDGDTRSSGIAPDAVVDGTPPTTTLKIVAPAKPPETFSILVSEDDPINSKIMKKRLMKMGHDVVCTVNGKECLDVFQESGDRYDAVLMDIQMPIMDGRKCTVHIRDVERHSTKATPRRHKRNGRIPVFAVSASLAERNWKGYVALGFDGWVLKPVDFKRLDRLLVGIRDGKVRDEERYRPGNWERGGWFFGRGEERRRTGEEGEERRAGEEEHGDGS